MYRTMALFALTGLLVASASAADKDRAPAPPPADVEKATKLVRELFKEDYAKTQPKAKLALIEKLLKQAEETTDDPTARYVLYREAADLAAAAGEVTTALSALDAIRTRFSGVKAERDESTLKTLATKAPTADILTVANYLFRAVDDAVAADELDSAERLAALAVTAATRSKVARAVTAANNRVKDVEGFKKDAAQVKMALKALESAPADSAASLVAGRYYCFQRGDWTKGLPLLAACNELKLKAVAEKEQTAPKDPTELLALADGWYDVGSAASGAARRAMLGRAYTLYTTAAPELTGLSRTRAEKRLDELEKVVSETLGQHEELFSAVRAAVRNKEVEELPQQGGIFGRKEYRESAPPGGILIGFHYGNRKVRDGQDAVGYLQPIYLTPTGEKLGAAYGKAPTKVLTVKAKTGYAVGSLRIVGGGYLTSCSVTFMKIQGKALNPTDKYDSPVMGQDQRTPDPVPGTLDGRPVIGLSGKLLNAQLQGSEDICTIGLIVVGPKPMLPKKP